jgi:quercetin dioxygenase-like cupin family protein
MSAQTSTATASAAQPAQPAHQSSHSAAPGRTLNIMGEVMTLKLVAEETGGACTVFESHIPPGGGPPMHIHHRGPEVIYVLSGEFEIFREGQPAVQARQGACVYLPQGAAHSFVNRGSGPARLLFTVMPGGIEDYFTQIGRPTTPDALPQRPAGPPNPELVALMATAAEAHGMTISGPPPGAPGH